MRVPSAVPRPVASESVVSWLACPWQQPMAFPLSACPVSAHPSKGSGTFPAGMAKRVERPGSPAAAGSPVRPSARSQLPNSEEVAWSWAAGPGGSFPVSAGPPRQSLDQRRQAVPHRLGDELPDRLSRRSRADRFPHRIRNAVDAVHISLRRRAVRLSWRHVGPRSGVSDELDSGRRVCGRMIRHRQLASALSASPRLLHPPTAPCNRRFAGRPWRCRLNRVLDVEQRLPENARG